MSHKETTDTLGHQEVSESLIENLSKLAGLARQAYEQKRTKDCLDLTRAILLIDPDNAEAQWMRSSVQSRIHEDLENARAFLQQAQAKDGAEAQEAPAPVQTAMAQNSEPEGHVPAVVQELLTLVRASLRARESKTRWGWIVGVLVVLLTLFLGGLLNVLIQRQSARSLQSAGAFGSSKPIVKVQPPDAATLPPLPSGDPATVVETQQPSTLPAGPLVTERRVPADKSSELPVAAPRPATKQEIPPVAAGKGTLAVSSPTTVDIYEGEQYLGSAPVSLELPAGMHTLEYRHGNLRKTVIQVINGNETARAMIAFDATVQINSRPWAEVFLDGVDKKDLGQTPLSGVRVPIGSVLIFQNPQFQPKRYRVTGNEAGIQIVFP